MIRHVLFIFIVLFMLSGCAKANEPAEGKTQIIEDSIGVEITQGKDSSAGNDGKDTNQGKSSNELMAIDDAEELVETIKERNINELIQLLDDSHIDEEVANKIIEGFESNFDLNTLSVQIKYDGNAMYPDIGQYEFILLDNKSEHGNENMLVISYDGEGHKVFHNAYIRYFPYAGKMVSRYLEIIRGENATELALFLNPDDIEVPVWVAEETISNYKDFLEGGSPSIHYSSRFNFVVENGKNGEHVIEVIYGDGLMSINDEFIPDF